MRRRRRVLLAAAAAAAAALGLLLVLVAPWPAHRDVAADDDDDADEEAAYARALKEPDSLFLAVEHAVVAPVHRIGAYGLGAGSLLQVRRALRRACVC